MINLFSVQNFHPFLAAWGQWLILGVLLALAWLARSYLTGSTPQKRIETMTRLARQAIYYAEDIMPRIVTNGGNGNNSTGTLNPPRR
jgi:hypothetical protein